MDSLFRVEKKGMTMRKSIQKFISLGIVLVFVSASLVSCAGIEKTVEERPKTTAGAAAGVAGGALIGGLVFKSATAAVVGGLLGGLAGGLIGNAMENKTADRATTAKEYDYRDAQGNVVRIEQINITPSRIRQGSNVNLMTRYALLTPTSDQPVTVTERWEIRRNGQLVGNPVLTVQRESGTWTSAIPITLPSTAKEGEYEVNVTVEAGEASDHATSDFTVI